ncbi:porin [Sansalvadorimonas verongulae]|uniref:porin n=1 Tax=Sansalvadorimonas verongulae TaxID=2172824 RepID=UPI0012BC66B2|nr:hypothetical protein [Sansalvadorimonas verongulae]MTI12470.1 hypothetical protein [Sansalvadorimonas verongulae]
MKKLALALAVAAISGQAAAVEVYSDDNSSVEVYGQLRTRLQKTRNDDAAKFDVANSRIGTIGTYNLSDDLTAKGQFQLKYSDDATNFFSDAMWVGLQSKTMGQLRLGTMWTQWDAQMGKHSNGYAFTGSSSMLSTNYGTVAMKNLLSYDITLGQVSLFAEYMIAPMESDVKGENMSFAAMTDSLKNLEDDDTLKAQNIAIDKFYTYGATWNSDFGLSVSLLHGGTDLKEKRADNTDTAVGTTDSTGLSMSYAIRNLTVGAQAFRTNAQATNKANFDQTKTGYGIGGKYSFDNGVSPYYAFDQIQEDSKGTNLANATNANAAGVIDSRTRTHAMGVEFKPSASFRTWAEVGREKKTHKFDNNTTATKWALGARYYF